MPHYHDRMDMGYLASNGEHLVAYVNRLKNIVEQNRNTYSDTHRTWFTHRSASPCWICNFMDCCDYLVGLLEDMAVEQKHIIWLCEKPAGEHDPLKFTFKPHKSSN